MIANLKEPLIKLGKEAIMGLRERHVLLYSDNPDQEKYPPLVVDVREQCRRRSWVRSRALLRPRHRGAPGMCCPGTSRSSACWERRLSERCSF